MFIAQQYDFDWNEEYAEAFLTYVPPPGIFGEYLEVNFASAWDAL